MVQDESNLVKSDPLIEKSAVILNALFMYQQKIRKLADTLHLNTQFIAHLT